MIRELLESGARVFGGLLQTLLHFLGRLRSVQTKLFGELAKLIRRKLELLVLHRVSGRFGFLRFLQVFPKSSVLFSGLGFCRVDQRSQQGG